MSTGWKIWFVVLGVAALYGAVLIGEAQSAADLNEALATGAPQQTVVGLWHLRDLVTVVILELIVLVIAVLSVGALKATNRTEPAPVARHVAEQPESEPENGPTSP